MLSNDQDIWLKKKSMQRNATSLKRTDCQSIARKCIVKCQYDAFLVLVRVTVPVKCCDMDSMYKIIGCLN